MRQHTDALGAVLTGSFTRRLFVNVFHGSDRVLAGQRFESWSLDGDINRAVPLSGSGVVVYSSVAGESVVPRGTAGILSPFKARLELVMEISAGDFFERVSLGLFRVVSVPSARDYTAVVDGVEIVTASRVAVEFRSLEEDVRRRGFGRADQPASLASCFEEIRRITGMAVDESVSDAVIPAAVVYEPKQGGRLDAVQTLADALGGVAVVNSVGAWTIVPDVVGDPVLELRLGERGTVIDVAADIDTETVYNRVFGTFEDANRVPIYAEASVTSGDLAVDGPYGENTRYYASDLVTTQEQADAAVASVLALSVGSQQYDVPIQCHINPLVEIGDVASLVDGDRTLVGRVVKFSMSDGAYMNVTLRVSREL